MLLTSYEFLLFLGLLFVSYYLVPKKWQWPLLLAASYVFYAFAGWSCLVFIAATTVTAYISSVKVSRLHEAQSAYLKAHKAELLPEDKKAYKQRMDKKRNLWLAFGLIFNFGMLAVLKYTNFTITNVNSLLELFSAETSIPLVGWLLPMGISFYVFQTTGYLIDVWRKKYPAERNFGKLALFVSFFPQLIQGPISRFDDLSKTLYAEHRFDTRVVAFGLERVLWGFFKKLVVADRLLPAVKTLISAPDTYDGAFVVLEMVFWAITLYADFTGGIDITIGVAQTLGIELKENFERPFFSQNIEEYWRRWHITMGTWFKDYIFYPLSIASFMQKLSKWSREKLGKNIGKRVPVYLATMIVWFVTGLWHGASWNFIVWGLLNGVVIIISQELKPLYDRFHARTSIGKTFGYSVFQMLRTFFLMSSLRLLDCYRDVATCFKQFGSIFYRFNWGRLFDGSVLELGVSATDLIIVLAGVLLMLLVSILYERKGSVREQLANKNAFLRCSVVFVLFFCVLLLGAYGAGYDASQFIYNQF